MEFEKDPKWQLVALKFGKLKHYKDEIYYNVDKYGDIRYWKDGKMHRDDGPSYESKEGTKSWCKNSVLHRLDGPAVEWSNGSKEWYIKGVRYYTEEEFNEKKMEFEKSKWEEALRYGELEHYKDEIYYNISKHGDKRYWKDGLIHRDNGPAIEWKNGSKEWYKEHILHKEDGPAIEYSDGSKFWFKEGKRHRLDGPAIEWAYGSKEWYIEGEKYNEEEFKKKIKNMEMEKDLKWENALSFGELKHYKDDVYYTVDWYGNKRYWREGLRHREDGPALEFKNAQKEWYKEGKRHRLDGPAVEGAYGHKVWFIEGKEYTEEEFNKQLIVIKQFEKDPKWKYALSFGELKHYNDDIYYNVDKDGDKNYWKDGRLHRDDGPATECKDGFKCWYLEGKEYSEEDYEKRLKMIEIEKDPKWESALNYGELKHYKDKIYYNVDEHGTKRYWKDGTLHRDDGSAIEYTYSSLCSLQHITLNNKYYYIDNPTVTYTNGNKQWYIEGVECTEEQFKEKVKIMEFEKDPKWKDALSYGELKHHKDEVYYNVDKFGNKNYWKDGSLNRDDGPAVEYKNGHKDWFKEGKRHRLDGPAVEWANGSKSWFIEDVQYTEEEFNRKIKMIEFEKDPKWSYALSFGELKHYKDDIYYNIDERGDKRYWKDGIYHRDDGPAEEYTNGIKYWYKEGTWHRLDGPAVEWVNGHQEWYIEGEKYTEKEFNHKVKIIELETKLKNVLVKNSSAYGELKHYKDDTFFNVDKDGTKRYWENDLLHRDDGPAVIYSDGREQYFKKGLFQENTHKEKIDINFESRGFALLKNMISTALGKLNISLDKISRITELDSGETKIIFSNDSYVCFKDGLIHNENGPAIKYLDGHEEFYQNGCFLGLNHVSKIKSFEEKKYYTEEPKFVGVMPVRQDINVMPANISTVSTHLELNDNIIEFEKDPKWKVALNIGELKHYKDEIYYNIDKFGNKRYWKDGVEHRDDGPAIEWVNGHKRWYIEGENYTEEEFNKKLSGSSDEKSDMGFLLGIAGAVLLGSIKASTTKQKEQTESLEKIKVEIKNA